MWFVDPNAAAGGDGTYEHPLSEFDINVLEQIEQTVDPVILLAPGTYHLDLPPDGLYLADGLEWDGEAADFIHPSNHKVLIKANHAFYLGSDSTLSGLDFEAEESGTSHSAVETSFNLADQPIQPMPVYPEELMAAALIIGADKNNSSIADVSDPMVIIEHANGVSIVHGSRIFKRLYISYSDNITINGSTIGTAVDQLPTGTDSKGIYLVGTHHVKINEGALYGEVRFYAGPKFGDNTDFDLINVAMQDCYRSLAGDDIVRTPYSINEKTKVIVAHSVQSIQWVPCNKSIFHRHQTAQAETYALDLLDVLLSSLG